MSLPRAVLEAEEKANKAHEEFYQQQQSNADAQPPADEPKGEAEPQAADAGSTPPPQSDDTFESRFKVLQGKYNAEVPRFAAENRELKQRLSDLEHQLEVMRNAKPVESLVKPEEIEEYGEGLIDVARRIAKEEVAAKQAEIDALKNRLDSLSDVTTQKVEKDFFTHLSELVPDWQQVNEDTNFLSWLDEVDELTGENRQSLLSRAEKSRDAARTAKFFTAFKKTSATWAANASQSLDRQVAPPTNRNSTPPPSKKIWSRSEISNVYARMRRGELSDKEVVAIEADIHAAQIEGRIR